MEGGGLRAAFFSLEARRGECVAAADSSVSSSRLTPGPSGGGRRAGHLRSHQPLFEHLGSELLSCWRREGPCWERVFLALRWCDLFSPVELYL